MSEKPLPDPRPAGVRPSASLIARALINLLIGNNPAAYLQELEALAGSDASGLSGNSDPAAVLRQHWNLLAGCADESRRQGRADPEIEALASLLEIVSTAVDAETAWLEIVGSDPFGANPAAVAEFFRRLDSLDSPGARRLISSLRVQKVGGLDPRKRLLQGIVCALDVPAAASKSQRDKSSQIQLGWIRHVAGLIRAANRATRGLRTEPEIKAELERRMPGLGWNGPIARALAQRRDPRGSLRGESRSFQVLAVRLLLDQEGRAESKDPAAEIERLKKATKRQRASRQKRGTRT